MQISCRSALCAGIRQTSLIPAVDAYVPGKAPMILIQMIRPLGTFSIWLLGLAFLFTGVNINEPYLAWLRGLGSTALSIASIVVCIFLIARGRWSRRSIVNKVLVVLWCLPALSMLFAQTSFEVRKRDVLQTDVVRAHSLGQHFVVGYSSFDEVAALAEKGLIAGVYITRHNISGRTAEALKSEIAALQDRRRIAGLPPLMIAADQEGGIVSHLSPPLTALPALSSLADLPPNIRARRAEDFGRTHGEELAALGVNHDLHWSWTCGRRQTTIDLTSIR